SNRVRVSTACFKRRVGIAQARMLPEREHHETAGAYDADRGADARRRLCEGRKKFAAGSRARAYRRAEGRAEGEGTRQGALRARVASERSALRRRWLGTRV